MRTLSYFLRLFFFLSLIALAQSCRDDALEGIFEGYTEVIVRTDPELAWSSETCKAVISVDSSFPELINEEGVDVVYSSDQEKVATISQDGIVTLHSAGTATITAASEETEEYFASSASYILTVVRGDAGVEWSSKSCTVTIGEEYILPTLANPNNLKITYSSSEEKVATISAEGVISIVAEGTTVIMATSEETNEFESDGDSFVLIVLKKEAEQTDPGIEWSETSCNATLGSENSFPALKNPNQLKITYSSTSESVATISEDGTVTLVGAGTTSITATSEATELYYAGGATYKLTVVKGDTQISWSETTCSATIGEENAFPTLSMTPSGLDITYSSSDTNVANISSDGAVTLNEAGTTTIKAEFSGNDTYNPSSATYALTVIRKTDEGSGEYTFPSTGDPSSDDDIVNTVFTRKIIITYSTTGNATVQGDEYGYVSISGNDVTVTNTGSEFIVYELNGTTTDGYFKLYSGKKQAVLLNGVSITNKAGAPFNCQSKKRTFIMIEGSNTLNDGSSYTGTPSDEGEKAALFSEGQIILSGSGSLTIKGIGNTGIRSEDYIRVMNNPTINVSSTVGHAVKGVKAIMIDNGTITAKTSADMKKGFSSDSLVVFNGGKTNITVTGGTAYDSNDEDYTSSAGIKADQLFYMNDGDLSITNSGAGGKGINVGSNDTSNDCKAYFKGGNVTINCTGAYYSLGDGSGAKGIKVGKKFSSSSYTGDMYVSGGKIIVYATGSNSRDTGNEAIESKGVIEVTGGEMFAYSSSDDAINSTDDFTISDGYVCGISLGNDGLDANGNFYIKGGVIMAAGASSPETGIDVNTESGKKLYVTGGVLFVTGGLGSGANLSQSCYKASSFSKSTWYGLTVGDKTYAFKTSTASGTPLVVSGPSTPVLKSGITVSGGTSFFDGYGNHNGTYSGGSSVTLSSYTGGNSGGGGRP